jgi:hypothetical protein
MRLLALGAGKESLSVSRETAQLFSAGAGVLQAFDRKAV